jgi:PQQ-like domain
VNRTVCAIALVLAVAGADAEARVAAPAQAAAASGWTRSDLRPITQPAPVAGRLVLYVAAGGGLRLIAVSARSGSTFWTRVATTSQIAPGSPPALAVVGETVFYLRKENGPVARLVAVAARSGRELWRTGPAEFSSSPSVCAGARSTICISGVLATAPQQARLLRFDAARGTLLESPLLSTEGGGREVGVGLFDPGERKPEVLLAIAGRRVSWRKPLTQIFTVPGLSTDWGWNFDRLNGAGLFVGTPGSAGTSLGGGRFRFQLGRSMTAGFGILDGAVAWRDRGSFYACGFLPCLGGGRSGYSSPRDADSPGSKVGLLQRSSGIVTTRDSPTPSLSADARTTLEGIDPKQGRKLWSFDAGHNVGLILQTLLPPQTGDHTIVLRDPRRHLVELDLATGARHRLTAPVRAWCRVLVTYKNTVPYNGEVVDHIGQYGLHPCNDKGKRLATPSSAPAFLGEVGARTGNLIVWSDTNALVALPSRR